MRPDQLAAVLQPEGWALLSSLPPYDDVDPLVHGERLGAEGHAPATVSAVLTQARLRARGRDKFGPFAQGMLFTPDGLEQATRLSVAARHAQRFASAGIQRVADLGCGIGSDSMALAGLDREVLAVDSDEATAAVATVNLRHWPEAVVACEDATSTDLTGIGGAWVDPSRRSGGRRVANPQRWSPPLSFVTDLAAHLPAVGAKVAPGIPRDAAPAGAEQQWVSVDGDVVECAWWCGPLGREGIRRSALVIRREIAHEVTDVGMVPAPVGPVGTYLVEPDGAVVRSGLVAALAEQVGGRLLDRTIAYVTTDAAPATALGAAYVVEDVMPFSLKRLRTYLRDRGIGVLTLKKRGTAVDLDELRRRLSLRGGGAATVVLTRVAGDQKVLVVRSWHSS